MSTPNFMVFGKVPDTHYILIVIVATFNHISAISWRSALLVEEIAVPGENITRLFDREIKNKNELGCSNFLFVQESKQ
jgi:hypothetical protein